MFKELSVFSALQNLSYLLDSQTFTINEKNAKTLDSFKKKKRQ